MTMTIYAASAPIIEQMLGNMRHWLTKAQAHASARGEDGADILGLRLAPDMLPLASQVRIAADIGRMTAARLAQVEMPKYADDEATLDSLSERVSRSIEFVRQVTPVRFDGAESRDIVLPQRSGEPLRFNGEAFVQRWALPNFFFHVTTTYALLRHAGIELGKADYLGSI